MNWDAIWEGIKMVAKALVAIWSAVPSKSKDRVIESVIDGFEELVRRLYRKTTQGSDSKEVVNG